MLTLSACLPASESNPVRYLPGKADLTGWSPVGEPEVYRGEDLFRYMNGGAEVYNEYGFREAAVQEYEGETGKRLSLEIFEMSSSESAFGMYAFKTTGSGKPLALGCDGEIEDYYLNFWKGRFVVTLAGFDDEEGTRDGLMAVGLAVHLKIGEDCQKPSLAGFLSEPGVNPASIKYFRGALGLRSIHALFPDSLLAMAEGMKAEFKDGSRIFIFRYGDETASRRAFSEMQTEPGAGGSFELDPTGHGEFVLYKDSRGESTLFLLSGDVIAAGMGNDMDLVRKPLKGIRP